MFEILETLNDLISCKMHKDNAEYIDNGIEIITRQIQQAQLNNESGKWVNKRMEMTIRKNISLLFRFILNNMEQRGMLTYKADDPTTAMGNFSD